MLKGQAIYAYVTLNHGEEPSPELYAEVTNWVRKDWPAGDARRAALDRLLPKTRSGKLCAVFCTKLRRAIPTTGRYLDAAVTALSRSC
ncbi:AMP-binding enzyme [Klebsiella pneumoniae]|uniref:AMP-binding enzyme n=1 Tax=Klebsiella pneumoniae TaxID=573 RepID=UPI0031FEEC6C